MNENERKLSDYIDRLNEEKKPVEHEGMGSSRMDRLYETVRLTKSLKEPGMPEDGFPQRMASEIHKQGLKNRRRAKKRWYLGGASVAALLIFTLILSILSPLGQMDIVHAMEESFQDVTAYHGILEILEVNEKGDTLTQAKWEVWADREGRYLVKGLQGAQKGVITANNGEEKWQVQPDAEQVVRYPAFPDPYRFSFELGKEIENVKSAVATKNIGNETIAGRPAIMIEVTPQGGVPYKLWVDEDTKLPLQRESAMENAIQYTVSYRSIDFIQGLPKDLFTDELPEGYKEVEANPVQIVGSVEEAEVLAGYRPKTLKVIPEGYTRKDISVEFDSKTIRWSYSSKDQHVVVTQKKATQALQPSSLATLGKIGDTIAEVQAPLQDGEGILGGGIYSGLGDLHSVRWQQGEFEYAVLGNVSLKELSRFIQGWTQDKITLTPGGTFKPQVEVPVDMEIEKADQRNADGGHTLYKLDPVYAAQVFVSLEISPEGIQGDYPVKEEELRAIQKDGEKAIIAVHNPGTSIRNVYLERLVRKDDTGIWTVVGYDTQG